VLVWWLHRNQEKPTASPNHIVLAMKSMSTPTPQQIVELVTSRLMDVSNVKIIRQTDPFLGGTLYIVGFSDRNGSLLENYVLHRDDKTRVFRFVYELFEAVAKDDQKPGVLYSLAQSSIAPGCIAILMAGTICYLAVKGTAIPEVLGSALTAILGFYFGRSMSRKDG
jgi:hypothetical protein